MGHSGWRRAPAALGLAVALAVAALWPAGPARAEWPERPVTFVVPYSPGGGFDSYVRAVVPEMERRLGTEIVVRNVSGAGGRRGAVTVYRAAPDGYTIGIFNIPGLTVPQLLGEDPGYELGRITWIGNLATSRIGIAVRADSPHRSLEDLCSLGRPMTHSVTGAGATSTVTANLALDMIGCPHRGVTGYKGSTEAVVALLRGEVDATIKTLQALGKYARAGQVRLLMTFEDSPSLEGVPASGVLGYPDFARFRMQRMIGGPPGIPPEIRTRLTEALMAAAAAPEVQDWSARAGYPLDPIPGPEAAALMDELMDFYGAYRDMLAR